MNNPRRIGLASYRAKTWTAKACVRSSKHNPIEEIEKIGPEFNIEILPDVGYVRAFDQREVFIIRGKGTQIRLPGSGSTNGVGGRSGDCGGVQVYVSVRIEASCADIRAGRYTRHAVRPVGAVENRRVLATAETYGSAAVVIGNPAHCPPLQDSASQSFEAFAR